LLFHENLGDKIRLYLIPSLAMYIAGTALLAYLQTMLRERKVLRLRKEKLAALYAALLRGDVDNAERARIDFEAEYTGIPDRQFRLIVVFHFVLLAGLI